MFRMILDLCKTIRRFDLAPFVLQHNSPAMPLDVRVNSGRSHDVSQ